MPSLKNDSPAFDETPGLSERAYKALPEPARDAIAHLVDKNKALERRIAALEEHATTDELTGTANRRKLMEIFKRLHMNAYAQAYEEHTNLSEHGPQTSDTVLFLDCDYFKFVNEKIAYAAGDAILAHLTDILQKNKLHPDQDYVARLGGDEFVVILRDTNKEQAEAYLRGVRQELANEPCQVETAKLKDTPYMDSHKIQSTPSIQVPVSITCGMHEITPEEKTNMFHDGPMDKGLDDLASEAVDEALRKCEDAKKIDKKRPEREAHIQAMNDLFNEGQPWVDPRYSGETTEASLQEDHLRATSRSGGGRRT